MIRALGSSDIPALAEALAAMDPWRTLGFTAEGLAGYLGREDPALRRMVVERDGAVAGLVALRAPWLRGPYVELLAALTPGGGIGRALLDWAAAQGGGNLWACVSAFNAPARAFYAKAGFVEIAALPGLVAEGFDEILLRRRLGGHPPAAR